MAAAEVPQRDPALAASLNGARCVAPHPQAAGRDSRETGRDGALSPTPRAMPVDLKLARASSETWTENLSRRSGPFRKTSASREQREPARNSSDDDAGLAGEHASPRKQRPVLPNLSIDDDMGSTTAYTVDEVELSSALSELTFAVAHENLTGVAMRHPPEVVRDRMQRVVRSLLSGEPINALDSADLAPLDGTLLRFVSIRDSPSLRSVSSSSAGRGKTQTGENGSRASSLESRFLPRSSLDGPDDPVRRGSLNSSDERVIAIEDASTSHDVLPLVLGQLGVTSSHTEYCLVAIDADGSERLVGDDEAPLALQQQQSEVLFRVRRRKSLELQNERLFKQIMEEEGQLASLEYFTRSESSMSFDAMQEDSSATVAQQSHSAPSLLREPSAAAEALTLRYYEKYQPAADLATNRNVQWELVGMPMNMLLASTLSQLELQVTSWQKRLQSVTARTTKDELRELADGMLASLTDLHTNSSGAYHELMDVAEKDVPLILPVKGYRIETCVFSSTSAFAAAMSLGPKREASSTSLKSDGESGDLDLQPVSVDASEPIFHHANNDPVYRAYFYDSRHLGGQLNFVGLDPKMGPMCVSVAKETDSDGRPRLRVLLWTRDGSHVRFLPMSMNAQVRGEALADLLSSKLSNSNGGTTPVTPLPPREQIFSWVPDEDFSKALLKLETDQLESAYKIGVLYVKNGQVREDEMFGNVECSPAFDEFLRILGDRIVLKDWPHFKAGLDTSGNSNGTHSVYTKWRNLEIMYHVSTLLPYDPSDVQQLGRKRHIGNDICVILFIDGSTSYLPDTVASRFNHVFAVVRPNPDSTYSLSMAVKDTISAFGPQITRKRYPRDKSFRDLLLAKLVNGQNAAYRAPVFREKLRRTREFLLSDLIDKYKTPAAALGKAASVSQKGKGAPGEKEKGRFPKMIKSFTVRKFSTPFSSSSQASATAAVAAPPATAPPPEEPVSGHVKQPSESSASSYKPRFPSAFAPFSSRRTTLDSAALAKYKKPGAGDSPDEAKAGAVSSKLKARDDYV